MEYIQLHVTKPPIPLDERVPGKRFPAGLGQVIARALSKKPEDRYGAPIPAPAASQRGAHEAGRTLRMEPLAGPAPAPLPPNLQGGAPGGPGGVGQALGSSMAQSMATTGGVVPQSMPGSYGYGAAAYQAPAKTLPGSSRAKLVVVALVFLVLGVGLAMAILYATENLG
jgi:hypothetical protein